MNIRNGGKESGSPTKRSFMKLFGRSDDRSPVGNDFCPISNWKYKLVSFASNVDTLMACLSSQRPVMWRVECK